MLLSAESQYRLVTWMTKWFFLGKTAAWKIRCLDNAEEKENGRVFVYISPKDFRVTSGFTAPTWYITPSESSLITTSAGEKSEVSIL